MKEIQDLGCDIVSGWVVHFKLYQCPDCDNQFKAKVSDVQRGRKRNCGCKVALKKLPDTIGGIKVLQDLHTINGRRRGVFECPQCKGQFTAIVNCVQSGKHKGHCGCYVKPKKEKPIKVKPHPKKTIEQQISEQLNIPIKDAILIYFTWGNMKRRCYTKTHIKYKDYGGRGITVCDRWMNSPLMFAIDMGNKTTTKHSLDRIDNNKGYSPDNCRWATDKEQQNNKRMRTYGI